MNITQTLIPGPTTAGSGAQKSDRSAGAFGATLDDAIASSPAAPENPGNKEPRRGDTETDSAGESRSDAGNDSAEPPSDDQPKVTYHSGTVPPCGVRADVAFAALGQAPAGGLHLDVLHTGGMMPAADAAAAVTVEPLTGTASAVDPPSDGQLPAGHMGVPASGQHAIRTGTLPAEEGGAVLRGAGTAHGHPGSTAAPGAAPGSVGAATPEASGADHAVSPAVGEESPAFPADAAGPSAGRQSAADATLQAGARQAAEAPAPATNGVQPLEAPRSAQLPQPTQATPPSSPAAAPPPPPLHTQLATPIFSLTAAGRGEHTMTLSVTPDDFGPVTVRAHIGAEGVRIELFAGNDAGREALRSILQELKRDLAGSGLNASLDLSQHDRPGERDGKPSENGHGSANQTHMSGRQLTPAAYNIRQVGSASTDAGLDVMA